MARVSLSKIAITVLGGVCLWLLYSSAWSSSQLQTQGGFGGDGNQISKSSKSKVVISTFNNRETSYDILSLSNKYWYSKKHGYDFDVRFDGTGVWYKLNMIEDAIKVDRYEWIWWIDYDTLITNTSIALTDIIEKTLRLRSDRDNIDLILTPDCWPLNAGSMLIRASPSVHEFIALVRECGDKTPGYSEQDCIRDIVGINKDIPDNPQMSEKWKKKTIVIPQKTMNAFPEEIKCQEAATLDKPSGLWKPGDFVIHFAGAWAHLPEENDPAGYLMQKYRGFIE